jgi:hypothetical protein
MHSEISSSPARFFFSPEYGGDAVTGGGHPADDSLPAAEAINDAFAEEVGGHGKTPGVGVPGSRNNPVGEMREKITRRAQAIWEEEGRPQGRAEEHWLRAEAELGQRGS